MTITLALPPSAGIDATDLFCGGGGSSTGLSEAGIKMMMAANHWNLAVRTHQANHPDTEHDCADISQVDPRRYRSTTMLWASPDCTKHAKATGLKRDKSLHTSNGLSIPNDPGERSRATMWDVVRFAEYHQYEAIVVENVIEVMAWAPFPAWLAALGSLGYEHQMVFLNSAHASVAGPAAATLRDRWYCVFTKAGAIRPDIAKWTSPYGTCQTCGTHDQLTKWWKKGDDTAGGVYIRQYLWHCRHCTSLVRPDMPAGSTVVDFTKPSRLTFDRPQVPVERTLSKMREGLTRHAVAGMAMPFIIELRGGGSTSRSLRDPLSTITAKGNHHGLVVPPGYDPATDTGHRDAASIDVADCTYRILDAHERKLGTGFEADYQLLGREYDQVMMCGNAVTPPAARSLGYAVVEALTGHVNLPVQVPRAA